MPSINRTEGSMWSGFTAIYALAHFGKSLFWHASEILFAYFLTEACGLSAENMGLVLAASLLVNAVGDAWIGKALTGYVLSTASAARVQFAGAIASTLTFLAFSIVGLLPEGWRLISALTSLIAFRLAYPFYDVPQNAILAFETNNSHERSRLSAIRFTFSGLANLVIVTAFVPLLKGHAPLESAQRFGLLALTLGFAAMLSATGLFLVTRHKPAIRPLQRTREHRQMNTLVSLLSGLWPLMLASLVFSLGTSVFSRLEPYYASFALTSRFTGASLMMCISLGTLVSQPVWAILAERRSIQSALLWASLTLIIGALLFYLVGSHGTFGAVGSGLVYGFGAGGVMMSLWAVAAQLCDDRPGATTQIFGLLTFSSKVGLALSVLSLGFAMQQFDYHTQARLLTVLMVIAPVAAIIASFNLLMRASAVKKRL